MFISLFLLRLVCFQNRRQLLFFLIIPHLKIAFFLFRIHCQSEANLQRSAANSYAHRHKQYGWRHHEHVWLPCHIGRAATRAQHICMLTFNHSSLAHTHMRTLHTHTSTRTLTRTIYWRDPSHNTIHIRTIIRPSQLDKCIKSCH